jgi:hypothetical protein
MIPGGSWAALGFGGVLDGISHNDVMYGELYEVIYVVGPWN